MNTIIKKSIAGGRILGLIAASVFVVAPSVSLAQTVDQYSNYNNTNTGYNTNQYQNYSTTQYSYSTVQTTSGLVVSTQPASQIDQTSATLNGHASLNISDEVKVWIEWGPTPSLGNVDGTRGGWKEASAAAYLSDLTPGTRYFYRAVGISVGSGETAYGQVMSFTTTGGTKTVQTVTTSSNTYANTSAGSGSSGTTQKSASSGSGQSATVLTSSTKAPAKKTTPTTTCTTTPTTATTVNGATIDNNANTAGASAGLSASATSSGASIGGFMILLGVIAVALGVAAASMHFIAARAADKREEDHSAPLPPGTAIA